MCFPYHRSPFQGTHGDRVAGDNTRSRHNLRHFPYYATSPAWQLRNRTPRILVLYVKSDARYGRRLAAPIPSSKLQSPCIRTLRPKRNATVQNGSVKKAHWSSYTPSCSLPVAIVSGAPYTPSLQTDIVFDSIFFIYFDFILYFRLCQPTKAMLFPLFRTGTRR